MIPFARIAIWALGIGAAILIALIVGHSSTNDDLDGKVFAAIVLFVIFSLSSLPGLLLIERQPQLTAFGGMTIGLSAAAFFVVLDTFLSGDPSTTRHASVLTLAIVALAASQAAMLLSLRRDDDSPLVDAVVLGSLVVLAVLAVLVIIEISNAGQDIGHRTLAVLSVLYLLGALLPPCLRWAEVEEDLAR